MKQVLLRFARLFFVCWGVIPGPVASSAAQFESLPGAFSPALNAAVRLPTGGAYSVPLHLTLADTAEIRESADRAAAVPAKDPEGAGPVIANAAEDSDGFDWGPALGQSLQFLAVKHGYRLAAGRWARWSLVHGNFFRDWFAGVRGWAQSGWSDGDNWVSNYLGHPLQGAVTGNIAVQNDRRGRLVQFGRSRDYWHSRLRAGAFAAIHSLQFEIGPFSEASIGNLGSFTYENQKGQPTNGMGQVDLVVTPVLGFGWMLAEDAVDRYLIRRLEGKAGWYWKPTIAFMNPSRSMANLMRFRAPWYRDHRAIASLASLGNPILAERPLSLAKNEIGITASIPMGAPQVFSSLAGQKLFLVGVRYGRRVVERPDFSLRYHIEGIPLAMATQHEYNFPMISGGIGVLPLGIQLNLRRQRRFSPYVSPSAGFIRFNQATPVPSSARLNYAFQVETGAEVLRSRNPSLKLGVRYLHLTNLGSAPRNPAIDSVLLQVGYTFFK